MQYKKFGDTYVVRLDLKDEVMESLQMLCKEENIRLGSISGIGTTTHAKVGLLETGTKVYHPQEYHGDMEIVSLNGTVSRMNGEVYLHIHAALALPDHTMVGGHLDFAEISAVAELFIRQLDGDSDREFSPAAGVNLLQFFDRV